MQDQTLGLPQRAVAAFSALGIGPPGDILRGTGGLEALLTTFRELEVPEELLAATGITAARTREKITAMVPLIWLAARKSENRVCDCAVPHLVKADDVPLYALDKHTRLGREAIWRFACENDSVRACLARFVPVPDPDGDDDRVHARRYSNRGADPNSVPNSQARPGSDCIS